MTLEHLLQRLSELEARVRTLEHENQTLRDENKQLRDENNALKKRIAELEEALKNKADSKTSKQPKFSLNYGVERNQPEQIEQKKRKRRKPSTGRVPNARKFEHPDNSLDIFPDDCSPAQCVLQRQQGAWRLVDGKAQYIRYSIYAPENTQTLPTIPGIRGNTSEYGIEIIVALAFLVYWIGISIDKAREIFEFFTGLALSKGQADSLLNQLAKDWEKEYAIIAATIVRAAVLYVDETGWKVGKKNCYTWIFSTLTEVLYKCGVGRGKDVLNETLGEKFDGTGVSDDYAAYDSIFSKHQLCWAHPLRKSLELTLRNPENKEYRRFSAALFNVYYDAVRLSKDKRLTVGREAKAEMLERRLRRLCRRHGETIVTEKLAAESRKRDPQSLISVTSDSEATMIRLQNQLYEKSSNMFVFVRNPEVEPTNNRSERQARPEALARKASRTSKTDSGAKRRSIIMTVLASLDRRLKRFTLSEIVATVQESLHSGIALFLPLPKRPPPLEN